jgi:hypothetical protein
LLPYTRKEITLHTDRANNKSVEGLPINWNLLVSLHGLVVMLEKWCGVERPPKLTEIFKMTSGVAVRRRARRSANVAL